AQAANWNYVVDKVAIKDNLMDLKTIKGSQFAQPLLEFSGACAGCGETPYIKLVTQLFGDRMLVANATGCTSIWGGSAPSVPYCTNAKGQGPAWGNSLFEDNAEYGLGMLLATKQMRTRIADLMDQALISADVNEEIKVVFRGWLENKENGAATREASLKVEKVLEKANDNPLLGEILKLKDFLVKRSQWVFGGDGWAYDIGYGGLDHVLASGEDVNVLVVDTEVYSNTGGQSSKATPAAAIAQFAASGKKTKKKDLGMMAMSYGYVYVAQVGMGADKNQLLKAIAEAEAYPGPSLVICYAPCINHGIKSGMGHTQAQTKMAVESGYWHLYRYNPLLKEEGKNPFSLDSKEPVGDFLDYLRSEVRYSSLEKSFPDQANALFEKALKDSKERLDSYKRMAAMDYVQK
ncbi:MAG TPA: thiamine pyrophosphate-dependent enzyme, partial [Chroococcales cyanobacterium]